MSLHRHNKLKLIIFKSSDLPEGIVEGNSVDDIPVLIEGEKLSTGVGVPNLARTIVRAGDELASIFVKGAICQGQEMSAESFEETEVLLLVLLLLLDKLFDELLKLRFARLVDKRLLEKDLFDQAINISPIEEKKKTG